MKNKIFILTTIIVTFFCLAVNSRTTISGGVITTQDDVKNLDSSSDIFFTSYKIKPPEKIEIDKEHLKKIITFNDAVHLERRIGIGAPAERVQRYIGITRKDAIDLIIGELLFSPDNYNLPSWVNEVTPLNFMENGFRGASRKCYNSIIEEQKNTLEKSWSDQIITSNNPQFERLVLLWHNHFVVGFEDSYERSHAYAKHILNLRKNAKGNLRDFLKDILKDPGMISYLNNDENFIGNVNENLGREFLELFTLGEGNYKENDVKNLSKLLTGHSVNQVSLEYEFVVGAATSKSWYLLGQEIRSLDEIVDLVLNHPKFSDLIINKFYREYISLEKPSIDSFNYLKYQLFYHNFEIPNLLKAILEIPEFWDYNNKLALVKSPIDIILGTVRTLESTGSADYDVSQLIRSMGLIDQDLIDPPNVSGWPGGLLWLDGNAIEKRNETLADIFTQSFFTLKQEKSILNSNSNFGSISNRDLCNLATKVTFQNNIMKRVWRDQKDTIEEQKYFLEAKNRNLNCLQNQFEISKESKYQKLFKKKYFDNVLSIFNKAHPDQLIVETMLINHVTKDFLENDHPSINISLYNVKLGDRHWDGFQFSIGQAKKWEGNFMSIESNRCYPECLDSYSSSFSGKKGTRFVKFSYPKNDSNKNYSNKRYHSLSLRDKLLVNRLYELTSIIISQPNFFKVFDRSGEANKEVWFDWLSERHRELDIKKIKGTPSIPSVNLINNNKLKISNMCSSLVLKVRDYQLSENYLNKYISPNYTKTYHRANEYNIKLNKLLVSDIDLPNTENNIRNILFNEAYQLK